MSQPPPVASADTPFVNEVRLTPRQWGIALALFVLIAGLTPKLWTQLETFTTGPDYRIPYALSRDYWLYDRRLDLLPPDQVVLLGDSVVWGEYVQADGTLSHYLNLTHAGKVQFVNGGVNGLFPLAMEGLVQHYASGLKKRRVLVQANLLWMTSPKADLSTPKEERFNHVDLVPQFRPQLPCYKAPFTQRLSILVERSWPFVAWSTHLQVAYFGQKNLTQWTLEEESSDATRHPNAFRNPLRQITLRVPSEPEQDPERGPTSPRHKPWSTTGTGSTRFEWVELEHSLQWAAFQRVVGHLRAQGNEVFILLGPFNEHLMAPENLPAFRRIRDGVQRWLTDQQLPHAAPDALPSVLYADASHPLTDGYRMLAETLSQDPAFKQWLDKP